MESHDGTFIGAYISLLYISIPVYNREGNAILSRPASNNLVLRFANPCAIKRNQRLTRTLSESNINDAFDPYHVCITKIIIFL